MQQDTSGFEAMHHNIPGYHGQPSWDRLTLMKHLISMGFSCRISKTEAIIIRLLNELNKFAGRI